MSKNKVGCSLARTIKKYYGPINYNRTTVDIRYVAQESCAIAKMTAQCALYMGALKIFGLPDYTHGYYSQHLLGFCSDRPY